MLIVGQDGKIVMMNEQVEILFGYGREELVGETVEKLIPMAKRGGHDLLLNGYTKAPDRRAMGAARNLTALRKDGSEFDVEISLSPIKTADGVLPSGSINLFNNSVSPASNICFH